MSLTLPQFLNAPFMTACHRCSRRLPKLRVVELELLLLGFELLLVRSELPILRFQTLDVRLPLLVLRLQVMYVLLAETFTFSMYSVPRLLSFGLSSSYKIEL